MTYKEFLNSVIVDIIKNQKKGCFVGLCQVITSYKYLNKEHCEHRCRLGDQIALDCKKGRVNYLDKSFMFRLKHGYLVPYKMLTVSMRNNMRFTYIQSLIAKEN